MTGLPAPHGVLAARVRGLTARRTWVAGLMSTVSLSVLVLGGLLIVLAAADRPSFLVPPSSSNFYPLWLSGPLGGLLPSLTDNGDHFKNVFTISLGSMFAAYLLALRYAPRVHVRWAVLAVLAAHVVFVLSPPLSLTDVFNYLNYGRMDVLHGLNPYVTVPVLGPHGDPSFAFSNWHHLLSPYGPLFTLLTFALVPLGLAGSFWALKLGLMLASLATIALVWHCARLLGRDGTRAIVFVGLNPLVLVWGLGGDHNDFFMLLPIMLAIAGLLHARQSPIDLARARAAAGRLGRRRHSAPPLPAAVLQDTAVLPPLALVSEEDVLGGAGQTVALHAPAGGFPGAPLAAGELNGSADANANGDAAGPLRPAGFGHLRAAPVRWLAMLSLGELAAGAALCAAVAVKASSAILVPVVLLGARSRRSVLLGLLAAGLAIGAASVAVFGVHLPDLSTQSRLVTPLSLPNLLGLALGVGGETRGIHTAMSVLLVLSTLGCTVWAARKRVIIGPAAAAVVALLLTLSWVLPWYVAWILPLAALTRWRRLQVFALVYSVYLILAWFPLQSEVFKAIGFNPSGTPLGQAHDYENKRLVR